MEVVRYWLAMVGRLHISAFAEHRGEHLSGEVLELIDVVKKIRSFLGRHIGAAEGGQQQRLHEQQPRNCALFGPIFPLEVDQQNLLRSMMRRKSMVVRRWRRMRIGDHHKAVNLLTK